MVKFFYQQGYKKNNNASVFELKRCSICKYKIKLFFYRNQISV